jgi:hypothetical protein
MKGIKYAFYVFTALKYLLFVLLIWLERNEQARHNITYRFGLRADWPELLDGFIFIPSIIIDGLVTNAEYYLGDVGDLFDYDSVVLLAIDTALYIKLFVTIILRVHSDEVGPDTYRYHIKGIFYSVINLCYNVGMIYIFVFVHLAGIDSTGMRMTNNMWIVLLNVLLHSIVSAYTSMMVQGITSTDRALKTAPKARVKQLILYIKYFQKKPIPLLFNLDMQVA